MHTPSRGRLLSVLALGVLCISTGVLWVRLAEAQPLAKAAWRCGLATLFLWPLERREARRERPSAPDAGALLAAMGAGLFLAFHFATWIASLDHTSVAASVLLVDTTPVWVALAAPLITGDRPDRRTWAGIVVCLMGAATLAAGEGLKDGFLEGRGLGNLLALLGALGWAGYALLGRRVAARLPFLRYLLVCYGSAAICLTAVCLLRDVPLLGLGARTHLVLVLLALLPQTLGHSTLNWALRHLPASSVALVSMLEPLFASMLAWAVLREAPPSTALLAAPLVLAGILLASWRPTPGTREPSSGPGDVGER